MLRFKLIPIVCFCALSVVGGENAKPGELATGMWHGVRVYEGTVSEFLLKVQRQGSGYIAHGAEWTDMPEADALAAINGAKRNSKGNCSIRQLAIVVKNDTAEITSGAPQAIVGKAWSFPAKTMKYISPDFLLHNSDDEKDGGIIRLWHEKAFDHPLALDLEKGKTHKLACLDAAEWHYECYIPKGYDPQKPAPALINHNPGGNGAPLSTKLAEETGWIMVGLTESKNGPYVRIYQNQEAALFDLRRRFNIDSKHICFSGMSGGARASSQAAVHHPQICGGLILIGATFDNVVPQVSIPIFFITGEKDMNRKEVTGAYEKSKQAGRNCKFVLHPGGHEWGPHENHEAAIQWLADQFAGKK